jgi:uncharacterized protein
MESTVVHVPERRRYELRAGDRVLGHCEYNLVGDAVMFTHTEVEETEEGRGHGSMLVRGALEDVRAQGKQIIPMCPFVTAFVRRHPEYVELVRPDFRHAFKLR